MSVDHVALKALLDNGEPFASDAAALTWVNTTITVHGANVLSHEDMIVWGADSARTRKVFEMYKIIENDYLNGTDVAGGSPHNLTQGQKNDTIVLWQLIAAATDVDLGRSELRAVLNSIDGGVVISNPDKTALLALTDGTFSRWEAGRHDDGPFGDVRFEPMDDTSKLAHIAVARAL